MVGRGTGALEKVHTSRRTGAAVPGAAWTARNPPRRVQPLRPDPSRPRFADGDPAFYRERLVLAAELREGPLPSGRELKRYREADPSAPRIILEEFRAESRHRRHVGREIIAGENRRADRGQVFALVIILVGLAVSAMLTQGGHDVAGGFIAGLDLLGVAALFLSGATLPRGDESSRNPEKKPRRRLTRIRGLGSTQGLREMGMPALSPS